MREKIKKVLAEKLGVEVTDIDDQALVVEDLGIDPTTLAEAVTTIQEETGIEAPIEELRGAQTVEQLVSIFEENSLE